MPYETNTHVSSSMKFSIGNKVAVNAIIGMGFIKAAKLKIDLVDEVVKSNLLQLNPIDIIYKKPSKHMPHNIDGTNMEKAILLTETERRMQEKVQNCMTILSNTANKNVRFSDDHPIEISSLGNDDSTGK